MQTHNPITLYNPRYNPKQYIHTGITTKCKPTHMLTISITLRLACGSLVPCIHYISVEYLAVLDNS